MASPPPPPPPPVPPPPPGNHATSGRNQDYYSLLKLGNGSSNNDPDKPEILGETETKQVSEDEFVSQVVALVDARVDGGNNSSWGSEGNGSVVTVAVVAPLKTAILQNGPMCGIVALAEALQVVAQAEEEPIPPKKILDEAIRLGYTKQGEMFSVKWMQSLAETFGGCKNSEIIDCSVKPNRSFDEQLVQHVLKGCPALVPYDADFNHSPSLRKGHAAHWTVVHGLVFPILSAKLPCFTESPVFQVLHSSQNLVIIKPSLPQDDCLNGDYTEMTTMITEESDNIYVIAHQGKSFRTALWRGKDLLESNQNLKEMPPKILSNRVNYVYDDIVDGLCSKVLLLK